MLELAPVQLMEQLHRHAGAGRAERVPQGDRAAVDVPALEVDLADRLAAPERPVGEPLEANAFRFESTWAANASCISTKSMSESLRPARSSASGTAKAGPCSSWPAGRNREVGVGAHEAERLAPERLGDLVAREHHRRAAVGDRRRVARGERAVAPVEDRLQRGERLERGVGADAVVARSIARSYRGGGKTGTSWPVKRPAASAAAARGERAARSRPAPGARRRSPSPSSRTPAPSSCRSSTRRSRAAPARSGAAGTTPESASRAPRAACLG